MEIFRELLSKIATSLDQFGIPYMVIGGQAVLQYGRPRLTEDIDITLGVDNTSLPIVQEAVASVPLEARVSKADEMVKRTNVLPLIEKGSGIKVDCIFSFLPYERQAIERSKRIAIGSLKVRFAAVEDLILHKLVANRARDIEDIVGILNISGGSVDRNYLNAWLVRFSETLGRNLRKELDEIEHTLKRIT